MKRRLAMAALAVLCAACSRPADDGAGISAEIQRQEAEVAGKVADAEQLVRTCLDKTAANDGVETTASGLRWIRLSAGDQAAPTPTPEDQVRVHYVGALQDGTVFDTSYKRGEPATFGLNQVIAGWTEGLQLVRPGAEVCLIIPSEIGYGETGSPPVIPPNAELTFYVKLLGLRRASDGASFGEVM